MSNPERLVITGRGMQEEICVTPHTDDTDAPRAVATPIPRDIATALAYVSDEWFGEFMREFRKRSFARAVDMARVSDTAADVVGCDADPGFGVDPQDSARLLELRQAIDAIGWNTHEEEERGDYLARLHQIREELVTAYQRDGETIPALSAIVTKLETKVRQQRSELRRFNREARARKESTPVHVTHDRWLQRLHALEQKTALGTATEADCLAIQRLKIWLGSHL